MALSYTALSSMRSCLFRTPTTIALSPITRFISSFTTGSAASSNVIQRATVQARLLHIARSPFQRSAPKSISRPAGVFAVGGVRSLLSQPIRSPPTTLITRRSMSVQSWYKSWTAPGPELTRFTTAWWYAWTIRFIVFGITGSSSLYFVRPLLKNVFDIEGTMKDGPWSYRIFSFLFVTPVYIMILISVGTVFGQQHFFLQVARRMLSRFIPGVKAPPKKA
eukprot:m.22930 g.22930  ORF g.22930 m.22930 type:complete len:221 (-) comp8434_c0_seq1:151-813(-)